MPARRPSPTPSDNEIDILGSLVTDDFDGFGSSGDDNNSDDGSDAKSRKRKRTKFVLPQEDELDLDAILEGGGFGGAAVGESAGKKNGPRGSRRRGDADDAEEDEAYIALQQAAAFRKSSNIKGTSVVKGGGFQQMGECFASLSLFPSLPLSLSPSLPLSPFSPLPFLSFLPLAPPLTQQASIQPSSVPSPAKASLSRRLSSARPSHSSWRGATSWAWRAQVPARRQRLSSP